MRKLQYVSDIHLEMRKSKDIPIIQPVEEGNTYLALCGDIGNPFIETYEQFLYIHSKLYVHILLISGNHEYYSSNKKQWTMSDVDEEIQRIVNKFDNITYLNKGKIIIGMTKFIGCTFWSDISEIDTIAETVMNDYKKTYVRSEGMPSHNALVPNGYKYSKKHIKKNRRKLKGSDVLSIHLDMREWILNQVDKYTPDNKKYNNIIILTHHPGTMKMLMKSDLYSPCYGSNCEELIKQPVTHWISGHTHASKSVIVNGIECISNCMGYPGQKVENYNPEAYICFE